MMNEGQGNEAERRGAQGNNYNIKIFIFLMLFHTGAGLSLQRLSYSGFEPTIIFSHSLQHQEEAQKLVVYQPYMTKK